MQRDACVSFGNGKCTKDGTEMQVNANDDGVFVTEIQKKKIVNDNKTLYIFCIPFQNE